MNRKNSLERINPQDVPAEAGYRFLLQSGVILPRFEQLMRIPTNDGVTSYAAQIHAREQQGEDIHSNTFVVDVDDKGGELGFGHMLFNEGGSGDYLPFLDDKPFVAYTETGKDYQHRGLGTRRLHIMNLLAHELHNRPLNSDHEADIKSDARRLWQRLVREELAERYLEYDGTERFKFKD